MSVRGRQGSQRRGRDSEELGKKDVPGKIQWMRFSAPQPYMRRPRGRQMLAGMTASESRVSLWTGSEREVKVDEVRTERKTKLGPALALLCSELAVNDVEVARSALPVSGEGLALEPDRRPDRRTDCEKRTHEAIMKPRASER